MAQRVVIDLVDDYDGSEASETVAFALDGASYEIDLSAQNAAKLRSGLEEWVSHARKRSGRRRRQVTRTSLGPPSQVVRAWAQANGYELAGRGRVPEAIQAAYRAANPDG